MQDFKNLTEVIGHIEKVIVIDLMDHITNLDESHFQAFIEPLAGVYVVGNIEPLLEEGKTYFPKAQYPNPRSRLKTVADILSHKDDIVDANGDTVVTFRDLVLKNKFFKPEPSVPSIALKAAIGIVEQYITSVSRHSKRNHPRYRIDYLVKMQHQDLVVTDEFMHAFEKLLDQVMDFIGDDHWNFYFTRIKGTSLIIEKAIDYRIYCYYENLFKSQEPVEE
jgi:hypothetical protein